MRIDRLRRGLFGLLLAGFCSSTLAAGEPAVTRYFNRPDAFVDATARRMAEAVDAGDINAALGAARALPAGLNATGSDGETVLLMAVERTDAAMVKALLQAGANPNGTPYRAPLGLAVRAYDLSLLKTLLAHGADPNGRFGDSPALGIAALNNLPDVAELLLRAKARIDEPDEEGASPACIAAASDHWTMVDRLLAHGASIWATENGGLTLGQLAASATLRADVPEGQARDRVIARLRGANYPWPPARPKEIRELRKAGRWPPPGVAKPF